ncbi:MAG: HAD family phosphatase [Muribaculaceae bacterium]|nr:HAD family phosphatase [Muribaculaceae bacterium]
MDQNSFTVLPSKKVKNLLFDLGGVIMNIEKDRCVEAFRQIGLENPDRFFGEYGQGGCFGQLESGQISADEWRRQVRDLIGRDDVTDSDIDNAFMAFLIGIPRKRLEDLLELKKSFGIYLLSNTNPVMWNAFIAEQFRQIPGLDITDYFDGIVTSFEAKSLKPSPEIFEYTARTLSIDPAETVFFDDSAENCRSAASLGWGTVHVVPGNEFIDFIPA